MASSHTVRPYYATIWFNLLATVIAILGILAARVVMPSLGGRQTKGFGQFGVVLVTIYWILIFPKLRKSHQDNSGPQDDPSKNPPNR